MQRRVVLAVVAGALLFLGADASAKGGRGSHSSGKSTVSHSNHSSASRSPGTGAKTQSTQVRAYTRKDGTHVAAAKRSTPDKNINNNWSTKGNTNPSTGKKGTHVEPPRKR